MRVIDFDFDQALLQRFLDWPRQHYASDPNWLPDQASARLLASQRSPESSWHNFLILEGDEVRGRVTALVNTRLRDQDGRPFAQLGYFECVEDLPTARLLVERAVAWLQTNAAEAQTILGPINFDTWHAYRLRTRGFEQPTFLMEPYNPPYYAALFEALGFTPISHYLTKTVTDLPGLQAAWLPYHQESLAQGYSFRSFDQTSTPSELALIYHLSLSAFQDNLFYTDIPEAEFTALYAGLAGRVDPQLLRFMLDPNGEPLGFAFSVPDHRQPGTVNLKTFGVVPRARGHGAGAALACEAYRIFMVKGFMRVNHCLMRAGNRADQFDHGLAEVTREYALYARRLRP